MAENRRIVYTVEIDTTSGQVKIDGMTKGFVSADQAADRLNRTLKQTSKNTKSMSNSAGIAGNTVMELGRTVTDINYGFRGVANNLQQLGANFAMLIGSTGSFKGALAALGSQLTGPLGILLAFNVVITVMERFSLQQKKSAKDTKDLTAALSEQQIVMLAIAREALPGTAALRAFARQLKEVDDYLKSFNGMEEREDIEFALAQGIKMLEARKDVITATGELKEAEEQYQKVTAKGYIGFTTQKEAHDELYAAKIKLTEAAVREQEAIDALNVAKQSDVVVTGEKIKSDKREKSVVLDKVKAIDWEAEERRKTLEAMAEVQQEYSTKLLIAHEAQMIAEELLTEHHREQIEKRMRDMEDGFAARSEMLQAFQSTLQQFGQMSQAQADLELAQAEQRRDKILNDEGSTQEQRLAAEQAFENQKRQIEIKRIKNEEKMAKMSAIISATRLLSQISLDVAAAGSGVATGAAATLKAGFPKAIPLLAAYAASAAGIIASVMAAKKQAKAAVASIGVGGSAGGSIQAPVQPNFNIVGNSGVNQLREVVEDSLDRPNKVYVTTGDVRSGEELERNAVDSGSL